MDFKSLKQEVLKLKTKVSSAGKDALEYGAGKLADSSLTLKTAVDLDKFIEKSLTTIGKDSTT